MKLQKDDVRLMQFVLNEISNIDRDIVQQAITSQPEIATEVANLKNLIGDVQDLHSSPKNLQLTTVQKQKLFADTIYLNSNTRQAKSTAKANIGFLARWQWLVGGLTAVAFSILIFNKSMFKEAQTPQRVELNHKELYAPKEETTSALGASERVAAPHPNESGIATKGKSAGGHDVIGRAGEEMKAARDTKIELAESESSQAVAQDLPVLSDGAAAMAPAAAQFKESELRADVQADPAKTVAIPTHSSDEFAVEKDSAKKSISKMMKSQERPTQTAQGAAANAKITSDTSNTGLLSAFGSGGARKKIDHASELDGENMGKAQLQSQPEVSIIATNVNAFTVTDALKQSVLTAAQTCLPEELKNTKLISMSYLPKDQKVEVYLTNGPTTRTLGDVDQQKCVSTALAKLTWSGSTRVQIAIKTVSK